MDNPKREYFAIIRYVKDSESGTISFSEQLYRREIAVDPFGRIRINPESSSVLLSEKLMKRVCSSYDSGKLPEEVSIGIKDLGNKIKGEVFQQKHTGSR